MFHQDATIHNDKYSMASGLLSGFFVNHFFLHPDRGNFQPYRLVHNLFDEFRAPENIHDIDLLRHVEQRGISLLSETGIDLWIHGNNAVSLALHVGGNAMAGPQRVAGKADHGDGFRAFQQRGYGIFLRQRCHSSFSISCSPIRPSAYTSSERACGQFLKLPY